MKNKKNEKMEEGHRQMGLSEPSLPCPPRVKNRIFTKGTRHFYNGNCSTIFSGFGVCSMGKEEKKKYQEKEHEQKRKKKKKKKKKKKGKWKNKKEQENIKKERKIEK